MAISHSTVRVNTWSAINAVLASILGKSVQSKFPEDPTTLKKSDFPMIVQDPARVELLQRSFGFSTNPKEINVIWEVYSNNPAEIDALSDSIHNYFDTTRVDDVHCPIVTDSDVAQMPIKVGLTVSYRIMNLNFKLP